MNLLGKMANLVGSLRSGSSPSAPIPASKTARNEEMKIQVTGCRTQLTDAVTKGQDGTEILRNLMVLDCPLCDKYAVLQVMELLKSNNQSLEDLKHISAGLTIIVKYAQHLIKKSEDRREQWRVIPFSNAIVQKKIRPMKGFETLLHQLGYTVTTPKGLSYPSGVEPNLTVIINLIADMMLFKREIKEFIQGRHPHPHYLQMHIPQDTQREIRTAQMCGVKCDDEDMSEVSSTQTSFVNTEDLAGDQQTPLTEQYFILDAGQASNAQPLSGSQSECNNNNSEYNNNSVAGMKFQTVPTLSDKTADMFKASDGARLSPAAQNIQTEPECVIQQVQTTGGPVEAIQDIVSGTNEQETVTQESSSGMNSSFRLACTVCGDEAVVYCEDCANKPLCDSCNRNWHRHPQRQKHKQECITNLALMSPDSNKALHIDGAYGISAQANINPARISQKQQTHLVKAVYKTGAQDYKLYSPELVKQFSEEESPIASNLPSQLRSEQMQQLKVYNPSNYQTLQNMNPQQHFQQPLQYQHQLSVAGFDPHSVPYQSQQLPYNTRFAYPNEVRGYPHDQVNLGSHFRTGINHFSPTNSEKPLFDNSDVMNNYPSEMRAQPQQTHPYIQQQLSSQQRQVPGPQQQQLFDWHNQGLPDRSHFPYPYNQHLPHPQQYVGNVGPGSYIPSMNGSMFHTINPQAVHPATDQMFSLNPQQDFRSNNDQSARNNQVLHPQNTILHGYVDTPMNMQNLYNSSREQVFQPTLFDIHQMTMFGNRNPINPQNQYQIPPMASQMMRQQSGASSTSSLSSFLNPFFDHLKQVPEIERFATCDKYIARCASEIAILEKQINQAMESDVEFCETEDFKIWSKNKAILMQRKKCLEECRQKLEDETAIMKLNSDEETSQEIHYPPDVDLSVKTTNKKPTVSSSTSVQVTGSAITNAFSGAYEQTATLSNKNISGIMSKSSHSTRKMEKEPDSKAASSLKPGLVSTLPPVVPPRLPRVNENLNLTFPPPKISESGSRTCSGCNCKNEPDTYFCTYCDEQLFDGTLHDFIVDESEDDQTKRDRLSALMNECRETDQNEREKKRLAKNDDYKDDILNTGQEFHIGSRILDSQEEVMLEKKRVQQEFLLQQQRELQKGSDKKTPDKNTAAQSKSKIELPAMTTRAPVLGGKQKSTSSPKPRTETNETFLPASSDFFTPPSTASPSPSSQHKNTMGQQHKPVNVAEDDIKKISYGSNSDSTLEDTLARFNEISMIDSLQVQGAEFAKLIKMADLAGFDVEAVQIAQSFCENQGMDPVEWLKKHWRKNVNMVVVMATAAGNGQEQNSVGEMSQQEAESAYISCHGNMKDAAQMCVIKRNELYEYLSASGDYPREEVLQAMFHCCGNRDDAERLLNESKMQPFLENIWAEKEAENRNRFALDLAGPIPEMCHSFSTSIIFHGDFQKLIKDKSLNKDRRIRMIFIEGKLKSWGRAELVIKILDNDLGSEDISLEDVVEAVRNCQDRNSALAYLQQNCELCFTNFPMSKIRSLNFCQCKMCEQCLTKNFEIEIREKHVRHWTCPLCAQPDMNDSEVASDYLQFLILLLQPLIDKDLQNLFEIKVRDWHLQKDVSFRWCAHCAEGFLAENQGEHLRMTCPHCQEKTCFNCKKQWEPQHEGLTCEQFAQWKIDNDPNNQSVGLAKHLDENGIDCPACKMRFALAKGGCMHFKCPQCGHEFCSGCNEPFHQKDVCIKYKNCRKLGLHCHCPRDCFSYLRDYPVPQLQQLLTINKVPFNINTPEDQPDPQHCPVMEQKEFDAGKKDEKCGKGTVQGQAGLCEIHYKEYLVCLINRNHLDPVTMMTKEEMVNLLNKNDLPAPRQKPKETLEEYMAHLTKIIQEKLPLKRH